MAWIRNFNEFWNASDQWLKQVITGHDAAAPNQGDVERDTTGHFVTRIWPEWPIYSDVFAVIDGKSSSLLTHISVMIAILTYVVGKMEPGLLEKLMLVLLLLYIVAAYLSLRCLRFWSFDDQHLTRANLTDDDKKQALTGLRLEMFFRQEAYKFALNLTSALTVVSVLVFLLAYLSGGCCRLDGALSP